MATTSTREVGDDPIQTLDDGDLANAELGEVSFPKLSVNFGDITSDNLRFDDGTNATIDNAKKTAEDSIEEFKISLTQNLDSQSLFETYVEMVEDTQKYSDLVTAYADATNKEEKDFMKPHVTSLDSLKKEVDNSRKIVRKARSDERKMLNHLTTVLKSKGGGGGTAGAMHVPKINMPLFEDAVEGTILF